MNAQQATPDPGQVRHHHHSGTLRLKVTALRWIVGVSLAVMFIKMVAWGLTGSDAILSDALESLVNIAASMFALFSVRYAARLRDSDHPYGHGKMEFVAAGFEGALISVTGIIIIAEAIRSLLYGHEVDHIESGLILTAVSGSIMAIMGLYALSRGKKTNAMPLIADGRHLLTDAMTSAGLVVGLLLYQFTGFIWIDPVLALLLALHILVNGWKIIRNALDRLLDKADPEQLSALAIALEKSRRSSWIDIHNLRVQTFGSSLHVDCHVTLPFFYSLEEVHEEIKELEKVLNKTAMHKVELFAHTDPCMQLACRICNVPDCGFRKLNTEKTIPWDEANLRDNFRHHTL